MIQVGKVTAKSGLHLRKKPDANSEVVTTLPFGTIVDIDHQQGNWLLVDCNFKSGYLYKDYVEVLSAMHPDLDPPPYDPPKTLQSYSKIIAVLVIAIVVAILAFTYGSLGWRP